MRTKIVAAAIALLTIGAQAQDRGAWRIQAEKPAAVLRAAPRGVVRISCARATQQLTVKVSSAMPMPKGKQPRREVLVSFYGAEESETWLRGYHARAATLTGDFAVEPFLNKPSRPQKLALSVVPNQRAQVSFSFNSRALRALADLRAACSAPAPAVP